MFLLPEKFHDNLKSKLLVLTEAFQNNHFLPHDLSGISTHFHAKITGKFFVVAFLAILSFFTNVQFHFGKKSHENLILF